MSEKEFKNTVFELILNGKPVSFYYGKEKLSMTFSEPAIEAAGDHTVYRRRAKTQDGKAEILLTINLWQEAAEWYMTLENISDTDTERFTELRYCDLQLEYPPYNGTLYPRIAYSRGSNADDDDFHFESHRMHMKSSYHMESLTGRSSDTDYMPYVSLILAPDRGVIIASGFSGSWSGDFSKVRTADGMPAIKAAFSFPNADFLLHSGESVRLPSSLILPWLLPGEGLEADGAHILFRRFIHGHMFPKINGQPAEAPICLRGWGSFDMSKHRARLDNVKAIPHNSKCADAPAIFSSDDTKIRRQGTAPVKDFCEV